MQLDFIGAATGLGAQNPASGLGPDYLYTHAHEFIPLWQHIVRTPSIKLECALTINEKIQALLPFFEKLKQYVRHSFLNDHFPVVIGGDHSCAIGSWAGILEATDREVGLLWFDAHLDSHTFHTSPSMAIHGMPLACLLGYGEDVFLPNRHLLPENVVVFGARSWEEGERELLDFLGVRIFDAEEIQNRGIEACLQEAYYIVSKNNNLFGISLDLDMFDPLEAPGVCSPEDHGVFAQDFIHTFKNMKLLEDEQCCALEIVEFAPSVDKQDKTLDLIVAILHLLKHKQLVL